MTNFFIKRAGFGIILLITGIIGLNTVFAGSLPKVGTSLPEFTITASDKDRSYLGVGAEKEFTFDNIKGRLVLIEIVGVYCPVCHKQFPKMRKLFFQIAKDKALAEKVKFLAITVGGNVNEIAYLKKQFKIPYPVVPDLKFKIHKLLGEPRTPFTILVKNDRKIVYAHLGLIGDFDKFLANIRKLAE